MPKPAKVIRPVYKKIAIPEDVCAMVDLQLWSDVDQKVPHGAWGELVTRLLRNHLCKVPAKMVATNG